MMFLDTGIMSTRKDFHLNYIIFEPRYEKICENKDTYQLRSNCAAYRRLCFRYTDSTIPLLPKSDISSL